MSEKVNDVGAKVVHAVKNNVSQSLALVYGLGMLTWTAFNQMNSNYWSFFLTDIVGLEAAVMGTVRAISGVGAWFFIIIAAVIIERIWLRHGQYRSWLLIAPGVTFICLGLTWLDPAFLPTEAKSIWMIGFQIVGSFTSNFFMIAATSLVPVISKTEHDRTLLSQRKAQGNMLVKVGFAALSLPAILALNSMIYRVPTGEAQGAGPAGFTIVALVLGIIMIIMFVVLYRRIDGMDPTQKFCEERYQAKKRGEKLEATGADEEKVGFLTMVKGWVTNIPAVVSLFTEVTRFIAQMTIQTMAMYFFLYVYGDVAMAAIMLTAANMTGLVGTFVSEPIAQKFGVRPVYMAGIVIAFVSMLAGYLIGATGQWVFVACICGCYFGMNFMNGTMMGIQSNAVAYGEWRDGKVAKAFIMSTYQWCPQIGNAAAGALTGFGLAAIGYVADMEPTPELAQGMINIICLIPAAAFAVGFILFFLFYRLNSKRMAEIAADLEDRKAKERIETEKV